MGLIGAGTIAAYSETIRQLLPRGLAWSAAVGTRVRRYLDGLAAEMVRVHDRALNLATESDPRTTTELLEIWEALLSVSEPADSIAARRTEVAARWTAMGGQTPAYYIRLAAAAGITATITEYVTHVFHVELPVELPLYDESWSYTWSVLLAGCLVYYTVELPVERPLWELRTGGVTDSITRDKPAHTTVFFEYTP